VRTAGWQVLLWALWALMLALAVGGGGLLFVSSVSAGAWVGGASLPIAYATLAAIGGCFRLMESVAGRLDRR
jgi:hypothetical protein